MDVVALIPAYEPDARLVDYVATLADCGFGRIVVVDDGSGDAFRPVFDALETMPHCTVLRHGTNRGKGAAIKTGLAYIGESIPEAGGVVTADSDGQHAPADCRRLAEALAAAPDCLHLGSRDFSDPSVPFRSRFGNRWSSVTFWMLHGRWLPDSQTGLRAFPVSMIPMLLSVEGDRFEYEMGVLIRAARTGVPMAPVPIRTIYENGNAGTHFRPLADTVRINRLVFLEFFRFAGVSLASFALDQGLAWAFAAALGLMGADRHGVIWASGFAARLVSAVFNYSMNRTFVFRSNGAVARSAWKYAALCVAVIALSNAGVSGLALLNVPRGVAKLVCDVALCLAGYRVQAALIFK
jgi:dolichol-phosphate mannosyltransferase